ncbi:hypothetical protein Tco_0112118 [Tanacetum coccineum]
MPSLANGKIGFVPELVHFVPLSIISNGATRAGSAWKGVEMPNFYKTKKGSKKSKTSETTLESTQGGFNLNDEADGSEKEVRKEGLIGRDRAKKKASSSSRYESSSVAGGGLVELVADKWKSIKLASWEKKKE